MFGKLRLLRHRLEERYGAAAGLLAYPQIADAKKRNPLTAKGEAYFSQNDEDGITLEIVRRIGLKNSVFVELGVGNGLENNTVVLLASGWRGVWIGGEALAFEPGARLAFDKAWVDRDNVASLVAKQIERLGCRSGDVEFLSIDLDGNDAYLVKPLLESGLRPSVMVCEYNGKFPPPIRFSVAYNAGHQWDATDYMGASLQVFVDLLGDYRLVCCNGSGINAFFVRTDLIDRFADVPEDPSANFNPAKHLARSKTGNRVSPKTVRALTL